MRTLTRQEAAERAALITVEAYDVELDFTTGATTFRSTTKLRFNCRQPGATTFVELLASGRPSIRLNGRILDDGLYDGERISLPALDATNELVVEALCGYTDSGEGMHRFVDPEDGETYLYSNAFLYEAQRIFACFDQPDLKATFELRVIASEGWTVLANGAGSETSRGHWAFEPTPRLPTYLIAVCAGPFESFRDGRDGIPLALHCRRSMARYVEADDMLGDAHVALAFFGDLFGRAYPFSKCDLVFVPEMRGAMENAGHRRPATRADRRHRP
jgi:aminopeptidase N